MTVQGELTQLRQVLMNLVTNAAEALVNDAGSIRVSTGWMQVTSGYLEEHGYDINELLQRGPV